MRTKIVVPMVALAAIPALLLGTHATLRMRRALTENTYQRLAFDTAAKAEGLEGFLMGLQEDLRFLSRLESVRRIAALESGGSVGESMERLRADAERELLMFAQAKKAYCGLRCLAAGGHELLRLDVENGVPSVVPASDLRTASEKAPREAALATESGKIHVTTLDLTSEPGLHHRAVVRYAMSLRDPSGQPQALLVINICIGHLLSLLGPLPPGVEAWMIDEAGTYLGYLGPSMEKSERYSLQAHRTLAADYPADVVGAIRAQPSASTTLKVGSHLVSIARIAYAGSASGPRWTLLVSHPLAPLERPVRETTFLFSVLVAVVIVVAALTGLLVAHYLARPVARLRSATHEIASGDFSKRVQVSTGDELEGLATDFNTMTEHLGRAQELLATWNEELAREVARQTQRIEQLQSGLAKTDKLASIGQMTAGVLHEVGNPLAAFKTKIQMAQEEGEVGDGCRNLLSELLAEVDRLTSFLRSFSRMAKFPAPYLAEVSLPEIAESVRDLVASELKRRGNRLLLDSSEDVPRVLADANQLRHLLINLVLNAAEASGSGEDILIRADRVEADGRGSHSHAGRIQVIDRGAGIPQEIIRRVWDPFFSTKPDGSGLGLAICRQIVRDHGGTIALESVAGTGTTVSVTLPAMERANSDDGVRT